MDYQLVIIGFGISGIATARWAEKNNLKYIVLEKNDTFGGVWVDTFDYTCLQTDKIFYQFSELEYPTSVSSYPAKHQILDYFNDYITKFNLNKNVSYGSSVNNAYFCKESKKWIIETNGKKYTTRYLAVCSGFFHNKSKGNIPTLNTSNCEKVNRKLVVGNGASANDFLKHTYETGGLQETTYDLIYKRDKYFANSITRSLPSYLTINPLYTTFFKHLPLPIFQSVFKTFFTFNKRYPDEKINYTNIIKNDFLYFLESIGKLNIYKKQIEKVEGNMVFFTDKTSKEYDEIIDKSGFTRNIPFLDPPVLDINTELGYNYCLPKSCEKYPNLAFIGFSPSYNWTLVSEAQGKWFTTAIQQDQFPTENQQREFIEKGLKNKNSNQVFNDLTYESLDFAKEQGISNKSVDKILGVYNVNNVYLLILISICGITLLSLDRHPVLITILMALYLFIYVKKLTLNTKTKNKLVLTGILFMLYGTLTESKIISSTGILNYNPKVKIDGIKLNFPLFLPLVYFFWSCVVIQIYETLKVF